MWGVKAKAKRVLVFSAHKLNVLSQVKLKLIGALKPAQALRPTTALPLEFFGPVDCSHGFQCLMTSLCRLRRSGVHPFAGLPTVCLR